MFKIDNPSASPTQPAPSAAGTPGFFTDGNPGGGIAATIVPAEWLNAVQQELINAIVAVGLTPSKTTFNQLATAMQGRLLNIQTFTASGTYTPTVGTTKVRVKVQGAGGAGGSALATSSGQGAAAQGGNAGAYGESLITSGFSGATVTIGAAGTGVAGAAGGNGGTSSFGAFVSAPGGNGGAVGTASTSVQGQYAPSLVVATGGNIVNLSGGAATCSFVFAGGAGAISALGGNSQCGVGGCSVASKNATGYGAGGLGQAIAQGNSAATGGNGGPGLVIVEEYA